MSGLVTEAGVEEFAASDVVYLWDASGAGTLSEETNVRLGGESAGRGT